MVVRIEKNEQGIEVARAYEGLPGGEPTATYIHEDAVADLLAYAAAELGTLGCTVKFCASCNPARQSWWKACDSLSSKTRRGLQALMRDAGVPLPEAPYEEVEDRAVPVAQHG